MNGQIYNNQAATEYLLGSLPEAETEHFDELSFTDDEFADVLKSAEKDLVDAYLQGELTGETLEKFKSRYLASPVGRRKVDFARAFQVFAEREFNKTIEGSAARELKPRRAAAGFISGINIFKTPKLMLQWGFAVFALALVSWGGWWIIANRARQQENQTAKQDTPAQIDQALPQPVGKARSENSNAEQEIAAANNENEPSQKKIDKGQTNKQSAAEPPRTPRLQNSSAPTKFSIAAFVLTPPLRGGNQIPNLSIPKETGDVAMQLQLESGDYVAYRVVLMNQAGVNLWRSGTLKTKNKGDNKVLNLRFPAKLLKSQVYSLTVSGISADGGAVEIIGNYSFRSVLR